MSVPGLLLSRLGFVGLGALGIGLVQVGSPPHAAELLELPEKPLDTNVAKYVRLIESLHAKAARSRGEWAEADLRDKVPASVRELSKAYERVADPAQRARLLSELALAHAELAWDEEIAPIEEALAEFDEEAAARLGHFASSEHFFVRVVGVDDRYAEAALRLAEAARSGYLERFGFEAISKLPGKKIRILIELDASAPRPRLYFHPTPAYHSELRYIVPSEKHLTLAGGQRIVYGFCHELGHMVAMWGEYPRIEDDHHAWAHYTGSLVVEDVYEKLGDEPWPGWTSFQRRASGEARLLGEVKDVDPGTGSRAAAVALFHRIGERFGEDIYGKVWTWLEKKKRFRRVSRVPYLWLKDLRDALIATVDASDRREVAGWFTKD